MRKILGFVLPLIAILPLSAFGQQGSEINMREGLWEITSEVKMPGMPMAIPPMTHQQCIKKSDLATTMPSSGPESQECTTRNLSIRGNSISYDVECGSGESATKAHAVFTYEGDTMKGTMKTTGPEGMQMTTTFTGRRVGDCP
ncbi:MAG: DUF3617 domain-containing protein [Deltaproteobacteria bacterium]|nr:DUF3617 domain-containing protein [Deltaproteobacteria bacterium]